MRKTPTTGGWRPHICYFHPGPDSAQHFIFANSAPTSEGRVRPTQTDKTVARCRTKKARSVQEEPREILIGFPCCTKYRAQNNAVRKRSIHPCQRRPPRTKKVLQSARINRTIITFRKRNCKIYVDSYATTAREIKPSAPTITVALLTKKKKCGCLRSNRGSTENNPGKTNNASSTHQNTSRDDNNKKIQSDQKLKQHVHAWNRCKPPLTIRIKASFSSIRNRYTFRFVAGTSTAASAPAPCSRPTPSGAK